MREKPDVSTTPETDTSASGIPPPRSSSEIGQTRSSRVDALPIDIGFHHWHFDLNLQTSIGHRGFICLLRIVEAIEEEIPKSNLFFHTCSFYDLELLSKVSH